MCILQSQVTWFCLQPCHGPALWLLLPFIYLADLDGDCHIYINSGENKGLLLLPSTCKCYFSENMEVVDTLQSESIDFHTELRKEEKWTWWIAYVRPCACPCMNWGVSSISADPWCPCPCFCSLPVPATSVIPGGSYTEVYLIWCYMSLAIMLAHYTLLITNEQKEIPVSHDSSKILRAYFGMKHSWQRFDSNPLAKELKDITYTDVVRQNICWV